MESRNEKKNNKAISRTVSSQQTQSDVLHEIFSSVSVKREKNSFFLLQQNTVSKFCD